MWPLFSPSRSKDVRLDPAIPDKVVNDGYAQAAIVVSADIDLLPAAEMAASVFNCPVAVAFTYPHEGYKLRGVAQGRHPQLFTIEATEAELRRCMLPPEVLLPDGRRIQFEKVKRSHFNKMKNTGS